jgi:hypothetical protein
MTVELEAGRIQANSITAAQIGTFDPELLSPAARAQWDQLGRRIALIGVFEESHPTLYRLRRLPVFRWWYARAMRAYVLGLEP